MMILKRSLKAFVMGIISFFVITVIGAVILRFTPVTENTGYAIIIAALAAACFLTSFYIGTVCERGGMILGITVSFVTVVLIFLIVSCIFVKSVNMASLMRIWYLIPVVSGALGGIIGVNVKK